MDKSWEVEYEYFENFENIRRVLSALYQKLFNENNHSLSDSKGSVTDPATEASVQENAQPQLGDAKLFCSLLAQP